MKLRRVLQALPLVGTQPVKARAEVEKKDVSKWPASMGAPAKVKEDILGWPKHPRWTEFDELLTGPSGYLRDPAHVAKEQTLDMRIYNRIPDKFVAVQGPSHQWKHGVVPGMGVKPPTIPYPVDPHANKKEPSSVTVDLADLRAIHARNRKLLEYVNVVCHTSDILLQLANTHVPEHLVAERKLMQDVFEVGRDATQNIMATTTASHHSHVIYERLAYEP